MLKFLNNYKGPIGFVGAFIALSIATTSLPGFSAAGDGGTTTTSIPRCGVRDCTPKLPANPTATSVVSSKWGVPVSQEDFNAALPIEGPQSWEFYNYPNETPRRLAANVSVADGFVYLAGTYKRGTTSAGAGISQNFDQKYGRWEVRARADVGAGFAPTILLWPANNYWPRGGEIDLLESPHGNRLKGIAAIHNGYTDNFKTQGLSGSQADWHTYAVDWTPTSVIYYVDDVVQWTVTDPKMIPTTSAMHLVLQNDPGCGWAECPNSSTKPTTNMQVDWIKVYALRTS